MESEKSLREIGLEIIKLVRGYYETPRTLEILQDDFDRIKINTPLGNVPSGLFILGGYMKEEVLLKYKQGQEQLLGDLYDAAAADALAGQEGKTDMTQEQVDLAVKEAFEKGVASVPVASPDGKFTQEEMEKYAQSKIEALPADTTPHSAEEMAEVQSKLTQVEAELAKVKSDDEADKAAIAQGQTIIAAVRAALEPKTPELPVGEIKI